MTWKQVFTSSIGRKLTMALTGIFLILFLIVHIGLNACIWANDNGRMFNVAAHFMGNTIVTRILEVGLMVFFLLHIVQGLLLEGYNLSKRSTAYAINYGNRGSKWYSRSMGLLGTLILLFLIVHLIHFWIPSRFTGTGLNPVEVSPGVEVHNLYALMLATFQNLWVVIIYVLGCISLGYHLAHGFKSAFRTMGVSNSRYFKIIKSTGYAFAIIVTVGFAMMPISMYLGWVK